MINLSSVLEVAIATHPGMVRSHNEDSIAVELIRTEMKKSLSNKIPG